MFLHCCTCVFACFSVYIFRFCSHLSKNFHIFQSSHIASLLSRSHFIQACKRAQKYRRKYPLTALPAAVFRYKNNTPFECATTIGLYSRKVTFYGTTTKSNYCFHRAPLMQLDFCYLILYTIYSHYYILLSHLQAGELL